MKSRSKAFTLVELLVSISIIALLIGILLPSVMKARKQANTVKCLNNMRQLVMAVVAFGRDNNDLLPNTGWTHKLGVANWAYTDIGGSSGHSGLATDVQGGQLWKYIGNMAIYHCPQDPGPWYSGSFNNLSSYCLNGAVTDYGSTGTVGLSLLQFHPDDVLFWELDYVPGASNGANDGTNYPSEGVTARHKRGTCLGHIDGHADILSADEYNVWCQTGAPFPNPLYCSPIEADGGHGKAASYPNPITIGYE